MSRSYNSKYNIIFRLHTDIFFSNYLFLLCTGSLWSQGLLSACGAWDSHCHGFPYSGAQALGTRASVVAEHGLSASRSRALE